MVNKSEFRRISEAKLNSIKQRRIIYPAAPISIPELVREIAKVVEKELDDRTREFLERDKVDLEDVTRWESHGIPRYVIQYKPVEEAWIVKFDLENTIISKPSENRPSTTQEYPKGHLMGFNTLENDVSFLGFLAGGDWESGVHGIIYWDGTTLRGYFPIEGNPFNRFTMQAYGNSEYDLDDLALRFIDAGMNPSELLHEDTNIAELSLKFVDVKKIIDEVSEVLGVTKP
ncbi:MAG TPA: hypothetical protein VKM55_29855 [Candidatus Lokiarchaeia archaeon]|nr:hypothetical protein [Candidatus Lokiarchaeia archaeon]